MKCIGQDSSQLLILDLLTSLFNILVSTFPVLGMDGLILEKKYSLIVKLFVSLLPQTVRQSSVCILLITQTVKMYLRK